MAHLFAGALIGLIVRAFIGNTIQKATNSNFFLGGSNLISGLGTVIFLYVAFMEYQGLWKGVSLDIAFGFYAIDIAVFANFIAQKVGDKPAKATEMKLRQSSEKHMRIQKINEDAKQRLAENRRRA